MKTRKKPLGKQNSIGSNMAQIRQEKEISQKDFVAMLESSDINISPTSFSKLESQTTDQEIYAISKQLNVSVNRLFSDV